MLRRFVEGRFAVPAVVNPRASTLEWAKPLIPSGGTPKGKLYDALLLDAGGTLLHTVSSVAETYATIGAKYGVKAIPSEISRGFRRAFSAPWPEKLRYQAGPTSFGVNLLKGSQELKCQTADPGLLQCNNFSLSDPAGDPHAFFYKIDEGDGRPFWRYVVSEATGCANNDYFEEVYEYFGQNDSWRVPPGTCDVLYKLKDNGVKLAVLSNFDTRLRNLLKGLNLLDLFDAVIISAEVECEKPAAEIFRAALDKLGVEACRAVHVGDDLTADKYGSNSVGIDCWLWGKDVKTFEQIYFQILPGSVLKSGNAV